MTITTSIIEELAKNIAEEALDGYNYKGKTLREWIDALAQIKTQIKSCKNTMCEFNVMGECGYSDVSLDESGSCINCIIDSIYTDPDEEEE